MTSSPHCDADWAAWKTHWRLKSGVHYLNHGSFGPPPRMVAERRESLRQQLDAQPMEFFVQQLEPAWFQARDRMAQLVNATPDHLALVDNATYAMNVVAESFPLAGGDEVLLTNHEYGAVQRIWDRACERSGATKRTVSLESTHGPTAATPWIRDPQELVDRIAASFSPRTRLLVVSHITSPTALILPIEAIVAAARERGVAVCVDGPHAVAQLPLDLDAMGCDFYCASCHKWLCGPFGTGFVYAAPQWHDQMQPPLLSWGRLDPETPQNWVEELLWSGTRDYSGFMALPAAIDFFDQVGWDAFRERTHWLAKFAAEQLRAVYGQAALAEPFDQWYGAMAHWPLPDGPAQPLQRELRDAHGIEAPIVSFANRRWVRVSCHLYNDSEQVTKLVQTLAQLAPPRP